MNKMALVPATPFSDALNPKEFILIKGAQVNNLKNVSVAIPRYQLVVITGLSGSGKSSLAFDTLFAEGQRMYVESLSSYARQFLGRMEKPEVEYIKGVSPAIAIEQKVSTKNPRSTVGTSTEIYDYFKLLFARVGVTYSPISGQAVTRDSVTDVVEKIQTLPEGTRVMILCPLVILEGRTLEAEFKILLQKGYTRVEIDGALHTLEDVLPQTTVKNAFKGATVNVLIDRLATATDDDTLFRLADSIQTAYFEGNGTCLIRHVDGSIETFSDKFEKDGMLFEEPSINLFTFNNPYGACKTCDGFGKVMGLDEDLVIPDKSLSVYQGAIAPWRSETFGAEFLVPFIEAADNFKFPLHRPWHDLTSAERRLVWQGNKYFRGLDGFFHMLEGGTHKVQYRVMLSRYRGKTTCPDCQGTRLRKDASYVKINDYSIQDLVLMQVEEVAKFCQNLTLTPYQQKVSKQILQEIENRLGYLEDVGLGYLTLNRLASTLSGGEFQRIKLATSLGSALVGSMYILDEPSIGLHPRDTQRLIKVLKHLKDLGNTVIVVEHEEDVMQAADQIIDIGPEAGVQGGNLVFQLRVGSGVADTLLAETTGSTTFSNHKTEVATLAEKSYTYRFLMGIDKVDTPLVRRRWKNMVQVEGARENNLKNVTVKFPLEVLTVVTGVSGSGKSTLVKRILYPTLSKLLGNYADETGKVDRLSGDLKTIKQIEFVDQNPIGKSSRSNPVSYIKAYDAIRNLFASQQIAKARGYMPGHFSFNIDGGRCTACNGEGEVKIEMQFMADIYLKCESCHGKRFKQEVLEITYKDKNIADILDMTVSEAVAFFETDPRIGDKLQSLLNVGLGYIKLGQSSNTLSGGEAQRVKLASFLGKGGDSASGVLFIFDEPTTGLHFHDINKLMTAINALIEQGNSVLIIEHNMDVIKCADWIIDIGPEGGEKGGYVCFEGTPEDMCALPDGTNDTAKYLKLKMLGQPAASVN